MSRRFGHVRKSLWFIPVACVIAGVAVSLVTLAIDRTAGFDLVPRWLTGDAESALFILSTIATSMISLTALVLTITMVVIQLAMGQFSPRIVETFLRDRPSQLAIGVFVATFAHAMVAMREVNVEQGTVPGLAVVVGYALVLVSVAVLVVYVDHIGRSLRVSSLIELVGSDTRRVLDERYPEPAGTGETDELTVCAASSGVVSYIDEPRLVELARRADCVLEVLPPLGAFAPAGSPLVLIDGPRDRLDIDGVAEAIVIERDRNLDHDVDYGLRMLVDIAERSLAQPFLDPTTAVQAIDRLHDCLRQLAPRPFPSGHLLDEDDELRVIVQRTSWDGYLRLAFEEIRLAGAASPQVTRRLREALEDLKTVAPPHRQAAIEDQLTLLAQAVTRSYEDPRDVALAQAGDRRGLG